MRVNVYAEEITDDVESIHKDNVGGRPLFGLRFFLKSHPDMSPPHHQDDDRSAVTFWFEGVAERTAFVERAAKAAGSN